jgi:hypothetical protein
MILADVMIALALSAIAVSGLTALSIEAHDIYDRASARDVLLRAYGMHSADFAGMMAGESRSMRYQIGTTTEEVLMSAKARWYGNDRIETDLTMSGRGQSVSFSSVRNYPFASIDDAAGTPLCSVDFGGGLLTANAEIIPISLPINASLPLTDLEVRNGNAYISADSSVASDPDVIVANISDPKNPRIISTLNTGPGIRSISLVGRYLYAAADSAAGQLHIIRFDDPASPSLVKRYRLPLPTPSSTPAIGSIVAYDKGIVYLGTEKWVGAEFEAIDASNPYDPSVIGGFDVDSKVNDIVIRDGRAYVASASRDQMITLDVLDPRDPIMMNAFSPDGWQRQEGKRIVSFEDILGAGRTSGGFDIAADHELFIWPPGSTTPISMNIPGGIYGMVADRSNIYLATRNLDREFMVINRSLATSSAVYYPLPVAPQAMTCDQGHLYILAGSAPVIYEITMQKR